MSHPTYSSTSHATITVSSLKIGATRLDSGGYADVYEAKYHDSEIAFKTMREGIGSADFLKKEWETLCKVSHPNIVPALHGVENENKEFVGYTMPLYECSLAKKLRDMRTGGQTMSHLTAFKIATQVCKALRHLHDHEYAHNDLKPGNILLRRDKVSLSDFGAVSKDRSKDRSATRNQLTPLYCAPERLAKQVYSVQADIFSFGVVLNELLSGQTPYADFKGEEKDLKREILEGRRPQLARNIPEQIENLIRSCWGESGHRPSANDILCILVTWVNYLEHVNGQFQEQMKLHFQEQLQQQVECVEPQKDPVDRVQVSRETEQIGGTFQSGSSMSVLQQLRSLTPSMCMAFGVCILFIVQIVAIRSLTQSVSEGTIAVLQLRTQQDAPIVPPENVSIDFLARLEKMEALVATMNTPKKRHDIGRSGSLWGEEIGYPSFDQGMRIQIPSLIRNSQPDHAEEIANLKSLLQDTKRDIESLAPMPRSRKEDVTLETKEWTWSEWREQVQERFHNLFAVLATGIRGMSYIVKGLALLVLLLFDGVILLGLGCMFKGWWKKR